jgi:PST family polysaccharide transporter
LTKPAELNNKVVRASKWSAITEIVAKLIVPITNMVLARLLTPEAFGIVTTLTMIITFAELFTDAGFQKYLVQHEFCDAEDREQSTTVAFWSNFAMSITLWAVIAFFSDSLSALVGNPGLGIVLTISCVSIPLAAFSSIQMALFRRDLDFKTLFKVRIVSIIIPLLVTIPLALWLRSYWALVIGTIVQNIVNAVLLTLFSSWKPRFYYSFAKLREMLSFTVWSLVEAISIWLTNYVDVFIVGTMLSQHYLGLYKTSSTLVGQIMGLITVATTPVLFSSLSRLQNDDAEFKRLFFRFQKIVGLLVIPLGVGIYCYSDLITAILLGSQWSEASGFIGLWGLTSAITIVLSHYASEVYRAKGLPRLSVLAQWLHIIVLWPVVLIAVKYGFETLYIARSWVRIELILVNLVILYKLVRVSVFQMINNLIPTICASIGMFLVASCLHSIANGIVWQLLSISLCVMSYFVVIWLFPTERKLLKMFITKKNLI